MLVFVMYYIYVTSGSSLLIESTDSTIQCHDASDHPNIASMLMPRKVIGSVVVVVVVHTKITRSRNLGEFASPS